MVKHLQIIILGKVENTGFRFYALRGAKASNITGEVKHDKGKVIIEAEGETNNLEVFKEWCRQGPDGSLVESLNCTEKEDIGYEDFKIL